MDPAKWLVKAMLFYLLFQISFSLDSITPQRSLRDGDVVVSSGNKFALGFFSPANSSSRYVGIWFYQVSLQTVVWVANNENPINDTSGTLSINPQGNLVLYHQNQTIPLWSASSSVAHSNNSVARLLETGNLVLIQNDTTYWQSFDHPSNIVVPSLKFGLNLTTGLNRFFTSWKSPDNPEIGTVTYRIDPTGFPQLCLFKGPVKIWRAGSWTGQRWVGVPKMSRDLDLNNTFIYNNEEISFVFKVRSGLSVIPVFMISEVGLLQMLTWDPQDLRWIEIWSAPTDQCDFYGYCGPNSNCDQTLAQNVSCYCLPGFEPKSPETWSTWSIRNWTAGCVRKPNVSICQHGEGFVKLAGVKIPDTALAIADMSLGLKQCRQKCLRNCSCMAYSSAYFEVAGGTGCLTWYGDLMDIRSYTGAGQDLFLRVDAVTLASYRKNGLTKKQKVAILSVSAGVILSMVAFAFCLGKRMRRGRKRGIPLNFTASSTHFDDSLKETGAELPMFDLETIAASTNNFSSDNRLGQGGFGPVYKGTLNGKEVAVKRLSKTSSQGIEEFKNEVTLIAKLQHRNLVRILGCCIEKEEKMLIYEYLPNKSLDSFIFDQGKKSLLDWRSRFEILSGIARGIVYLHQDSRLRIIHRDLKASNILLDADMNPKISDFGMARMFGGNQIEANTERVVGTYGYMSPEYAMEGHFSIKSDVYSFGVLLLEIITGRRNSGHYPDSPTMNLIGHVWELWRNGKAMEIVDSSLGGAYPTAEVLRCIEIGLLCVQESVTDRPKMSVVVAMLGNDVALPSPTQPAYIIKKTDREDETGSSQGTRSVNMGTLNGKEIAVKRLSQSSRQGMEEFKNEVTLIAKLQHRNLVRILGCCIEKEEKMLIYEYLPNKSLDCFIFDEGKRPHLDWRRRFEIFYGIARGIAYLHQDSRLRIIHRDLKASNILLDAGMNPKISDFGMARIFGGDQVEANTTRVVGTYGVLLLEIITGRRNNGNYPDSPSSSLIGHVWELWINNKAMEIVDSSLGGDYPRAEVLRCLQIGLLCVQENLIDRPKMSAVVAMLDNDVSLPSPKQPAFLSNQTNGGDDERSSSLGTGSINMVTLSMPHAR